MKIIICTLRRSGSTVFWKAFRENTDFKCYDEPFNPGLSVLPKEHRKEVYGEYIDLINEDSALFWRKFSTISPIEENKSSLTSEQKDYFRYLLDSAEDVVIDTTRCWNKLESLKEVLEPYPHIFIHLYRDPIAFASSHLLPSEIKSWRYNRRLKKEFWTKTKGFNYWKMEEVLGNGLGSAFDSLVMKEFNLNISSQTFYDAPAYAKLSFFSVIVNKKMEEVGRKIFRDKFMSVSFEMFCESPKEFFKELDYFLEEHIEYFELSHIKLASKGYQINNSKWKNDFFKITPL